MISPRFLAQQFDDGISDAYSSYIDDKRFFGGPTDSSGGQMQGKQGSLPKHQMTKQSNMYPQKLQHLFQLHSTPQMSLQSQYSSGSPKQIWQIPDSVRLLHFKNENLKMDFASLSRIRQNKLTNTLKS